MKNDEIRKEIEKVHENMEPTEIGKNHYTNKTI